MNAYDNYCWVNWAENCWLDSWVNNRYIASHVYSFKRWYICLVNPPYNGCCKHPQYIYVRTRIILYGFSSKPSDKLFACVYFAAYSYLPGCCPHNSFTPTTSVSLLWLFGYRLSGYISYVSQQLNSWQNDKFCGHCVESLLGSLMLSSIHSTTRLLTRQEVIIQLPIFTLYGIEASYIPLLEWYHCYYTRPGLRLGLV